MRWSRSRASGWPPSRRCVRPGWSTWWPSGSGCVCTRARSSARWPGSPKVRETHDDDERVDDDDDDGGGHVERYEQLRARALAGDGAGWQLGLALLQRRGVLAWTRAWPQQPAPVRACRPAPVPAAADELVGALATMALARLAA